ncbi:helix-turn-helix transcriptional regulator [Fictibacillus sp. Mic-4]
MTWLAQKTEINRNTLHSYIRGTDPSLSNAYKIADALNKTVYEIWPPNK